MNDKDKNFLATINSLWEKFTLQPLQYEVDFFESGGDSLSAINMIVEIKKLFSIEISLEKFMKNPFISCLIETIQESKD